MSVDVVGALYALAVAGGGLAGYLKAGPSPFLFGRDGKEGEWDCEVASPR